MLPENQSSAIPGLQVAFETVMIIRDLFTGGKRSFATTADAREFRAGIYTNHGLKVPASTPHAPPPQVCFASLSQHLPSVQIRQQALLGNLLGSLL